MPYIIRKDSTAIRREINEILDLFSARDLGPLQDAINECWSTLKQDPRRGYRPSANDPNWWHIKDSRKHITLIYEIDVPAPGHVFVTGVKANQPPTP